MAARRQISIAFPRQISVSDAVESLMEQLLASLLGGGATVVAPAPVNPPAAPPTVEPAPGDLSSTAGIAQRFLEVLGAPVEDTRLSMVSAWISCEKPADAPAQWNNPMNTTLVTSASVGAANSVGVQEYATMEDGIQANVNTLEQANMSHIRNALFAADVSGFVAGLSSDPWGTSPSCVASYLGV